jgi:peptidase E
VNEDQRISLLRHYFKNAHYIPYLSKKQHWWANRCAEVIKKQGSFLVSLSLTENNAFELN